MVRLILECGLLSFLLLHQLMVLVRIMTLVCGHQVVEVGDFHEVQVVALVRLGLVLRLIAARECR